MRMSLNRMTMTIGSFIVAAIVATVSVSSYTLSQLEIGSDPYRKIIAGKDYVSDLLPPPLFLVEAWLAMETGAADHAGAETVRKQLEPLRKAYEARRDAWLQSPDIPQNIKSIIRIRANPDADAFWKEAFGGLLPALDKGIAADILAERAKMAKLYARHFESVNAQVKAAEDFARDAEAVAMQRTSSLTMLNFAVAFVSVASVALMFWRIKRHLTEPVVELSAYMRRVATAQETADPPYRNRNDEIGEMSSTIAYFKSVVEQVRAAEAEAAAQKAKVADQLKDRESGAKWYIENRDFFFKEYEGAMTRLSNGDLVVRLDKPFIKDYESLRTTFNAALVRLNEAMSGVVGNAGAIDNAIQEISSAIGELSRRNETQAATLAQTAAGVDQITTQVKGMAEGAVAAREAVHVARADAESGEKIVGEVVAAIDDISQSSDKIRQIIGLIDEIAFQTNLLALNAGVEAARAGEAGRGFAVVATEVRNLAQRSTEAAKEIKALISESTDKVQAGVTLASTSGDSLRRIVEQVSRILGIVDEIAHGADAQFRGLREVNTAVQEIDRVTQQNAAMAEEINATSRGLADDSASLKSLVGQFSIEAGRRQAASAPRSAAPPAAAPRRANAAKASSVAGKTARKADPAVDTWEEF